MKKTRRRALYVFAALLAVVFVLACLVGFAACGGGDEAEVESVSLSSTSLSIEEGKSATVTASVKMSDDSAYGGSYAWTTSDSSVATVSGSGATGTVTAVKAGSATVTLTVDNSKTATCSVTVTEAAPAENENVVAVLYADSFKMNYSGIELSTTNLVVTLYSDGTANLDCDMMQGYGCTYSITDGTMTFNIAGLGTSSTGTVIYGTDGSIQAVTFTNFAGVAQDLTLAVEGYTPAATVVTVLYADSFTMYGGMMTAKNVVVTLYDDGNANLDCDLMQGYGCTYSISNGTMTFTIAGLQSTSYGTVVYDTDGETILAVTFTEFAGDTQDFTLAADGYTPASNEEDLVEALVKGGEVTIAKDIEITTALEVEADTTINLAGNSITTGEDWTSTAGYYVSEALITVTAGVTLTIADNTGSGKISYDYTTTEKATNSSDNKTADWNSSVYNGAAIEVEEGGTLVIESGTISSSSVGVRAEGVDSDVENTRATVTISGGTIESTYFSIWASGDADVTIADGATISGENKGICIGGDSNFGYSDYQTGTVTTLNVTGGTISCDNDSAICTLGVGSADSAVITISGGTITGATELTYTDENKTSVKTTYPAVYIPSGTLNITGGTITGITAVEIRGGTASITGGTLAVYEGITAGTITNSSGATSYGYQLCVNPYGTTNRAELGDYSDSISVTVSATVITDMSTSVYIASSLACTAYDESDQLIANPASDTPSYYIIAKAASNGD